MFGFGLKEVNTYNFKENIFSLFRKIDKEFYDIEMEYNGDLEKIVYYERIYSRKCYMDGFLGWLIHKINGIFQSILNLIEFPSAYKEARIATHNIISSRSFSGPLQHSQNDPNLSTQNLENYYCEQRKKGEQYIEKILEYVRRQFNEFGDAATFPIDK